MGGDVMSDIIDYIYFDADNRSVVESLESLKAIYFKGMKTVYEHSYANPESGQVLHAMSSSPNESELSLRLRMHGASVIR